MNPPAFQFYGDDFLAGTIEMSQAEVGAYMRLLCHQWSRGQIPDDDEKLRRIAGGSVSDDVLAKFPKWEDGLRRNRRLERERTKQEEYRESQRRKGQLSAAARGHKPTTHPTPTGTPTDIQPHTQPDANRGSTAVQPRLEPDGQPKGNSPSPSPSPSPSSEEGASTETREAGQPTLPEQPVELPPGFPRSIEVAVVAADTVGCTREFATTQWHQAMSRGGRDARDVPIRSWPGYLAACRDYQANRDAERQQREKSGGPARPDARNLIARIRTLEQEVADHRGNPDNTRGSAVAKKACRPGWLEKCRELAALRKQLSEGGGVPA